MCEHLRRGWPATATSPSYCHPIDAAARRRVLNFYDDAGADEVAYGTIKF